MVRSQNDVNSNITRTNEKFVELNRELQRERTGLQNERLTLSDQFERLEQGRRDLHRERRSELAWSESFNFLALVLAAAMPLFLCAYLIWMAAQSSIQQEEVNSILLNELVSTKPRLFVAPNLAAIEHSETDNRSPDANETSTDKSKRRKKHLTHRKDQNRGA